ncbi:Domain of uncharacterised function (DUF3560) [Mycobacterium tuberculosis]|nr:Domain of uncharacterised function (DUF3560) [Mycobacterium tuberculosis]
MTISSFKEKRQEKIEQLRQRANQLDRQAAQYRNTPEIRARRDMFGEPVKIGHHSERRHRRLLERTDRQIRRSIECTKKARELRRRAERMEKDSTIYSDDPEALQKLKADLIEAEEVHKAMKRINAEYRQAKGDIDAMENISEGTREGLKKAKASYPFGAANFKPFDLTNSNARIRRIKERIRKIEAAAEDETREIPFTGGLIVDNVEANRIQIVFDKKPGDKLRSSLKRNGFRWSPRNQAWQRHRNKTALYVAQEIIKGEGSC